MLPLPHFTSGLMMAGGCDRLLPAHARWWSPLREAKICEACFAVTLISTPSSSACTHALFCMHILSWSSTGRMSRHKIVWVKCDIPLQHCWHHTCIASQQASCMVTSFAAMQDIVTWKGDLYFMEGDAQIPQPLEGSVIAFSCNGVPQGPAYRYVQLFQ